MKTSISAAAAVLAALFATAAAQQTTAKGVQRPSATPVLGAERVQGCFSASGELKLMDKQLAFNSLDSCAKKLCGAQGYKVAGTYRANECWCGDKYPPADKLVSDDKCNAPCAGYDWDACGGKDTWTIYNTGLDIFVDNSEDQVSSSSSASSEPTQAPVDSSKPSASQSKAPSSGGGPNTAGIAAGVVVGIVAIAGIGAGIWFFMRRRRNAIIEEEHRRNAAVNAFIHGSKPPSSSGMSMTDSRVDPTLAQRRMSDGSIADNQDYSRRILRVTNA